MFLSVSLLLLYQYMLNFTLMVGQTLVISGYLWIIGRPFSI